MWINPENLSIYRAHSEIRSAFKNVSFPAAMSEDDIESVGLMRIAPTQAPSHDSIYEQVIEATPVKIGDSWTQQWQVVQLSQSQIDDNMAAAKARKNEQINGWRLAANRSTFTHLGKTFACDELSRSDIDGVTSFVTLTGALPPGWPGGWKAVDNTYLAISSVAEWTAFIGSMVSAGNANFGRAQALKAQLAAATTYNQIEAIVW